MEDLRKAGRTRFVQGTDRDTIGLVRAGAEFGAPRLLGFRPWHEPCLINSH